MTLFEERLRELPLGDVIVCPAQSDDDPESEIGLTFLIKYHAWGHIRVAKSPHYFALYENYPVQQVRYFGVIEKIISPTDPESPTKDLREAPEMERQNKKVIIIKKGTLKKLHTPIEFRNLIIRNIRYVHLDKFLKARTTKDLV